MLSNILITISACQARFTRSLCGYFLTDRTGTAFIKSPARYKMTGGVLPLINEFPILTSGLCALPLPEI
jgi:hypothetical protein